MKNLKLVLYRHAKTEDQSALGDDMSRALTRRGKNDAHIMAQRLAMVFKPQLILVSPAVRTMQTYEILIQTNGWEPIPVKKEPELYMPSLETLLQCIFSLPPNLHSVLILGHNFALTDAINLLTNTRLDNLPTAGFALINTQVPSGSILNKHTGILDVIEYPNIFKV